jgi:hypothetical protein
VAIVLKITGDLILKKCSVEINAKNNMEVKKITAFVRASKKFEDF